MPGSLFQHFVSDHANKVFAKNKIHYCGIFNHSDHVDINALSGWTHGVCLCLIREYGLKNNFIHLEFPSGILYVISASLFCAYECLFLPINIYISLPSFMLLTGCSAVLPAFCRQRWKFLHGSDVLGSIFVWWWFADECYLAGWVHHATVTWISRMMQSHAIMGWLCDFEDILPKGPYLPCLSMAGRALLAGYSQFLKGS